MLMTQDGEPFSQEELDEMLEIAIDPLTQTVPYEYYLNKLMVKVLLQKYPYSFENSISFCLVANAVTPVIKSSLCSIP